MSDASIFDRVKRGRVTVREIGDAKRAGERWAMLTAYDALTARLFEESGVPVLLVGDSAGMVVFGETSTVPVTLDQMATLTAAVSRGTQRAMVVADLPFGTYQASPEGAFASAVRLMQAGAQAVKLEGGTRMAPHVSLLASSGIPVVAHVGLTPQSVHAFGGFRVQGRGDAGDTLIEDARALQDAGAFAVVIEAVPAELGARATAALSIPTIGIGAGAACDAQVLVWQDAMGLTPAAPRFVRRFADLRAAMGAGVREYVASVRDGSFPAAEHTYD